MKDVYKQDRGVTPIIATILLIGITVILAATLIAILSTFNNSSHIHNLDSQEYLSGPYNSTGANTYYLNVTSTSQLVPLGQVNVEIFNGSTLVYSGNLLNKSSKGITITDTVSDQLSAGNSIIIEMSGKQNKITSMTLIYASTVFATVTPT